MTPAEQCKQAGLKSLAELSQIAQIPVRTLYDWHENKPQAFRLLLNGAVAEKYHQPA